MKNLKHKTISLFTISLFMFMFSANADNLALLGTATASSGTTASLAIDGDNGTRWESDQAAANIEYLQWFVLKLDATYTLGNVVITWEGANADIYTIDVSTDSIAWTEVYSQTEYSGSLTDEISVDADAKFVRINCNHRRLNNYGYSIFELEVYEVVDETQNATLNDLLVDASTITGFESGIKEYTYFVNDGNVPVVTATATILGADVVITPAASIPGTTTIVVTATDLTTTDTYEIVFKEPVAFPLDFESTTLMYKWTDFGAPATVIDNPQISGINTSLKVSQIIKNAGPDWAGSTVYVDTPIDLSSDTRVSAKFYSPREGSKIMMKLEDANNHITAEIHVATTVANQWETLTFDFAGANTSYEYGKVVIICDRDSVGDGTAAYTYLVDDIAMYVADPAKDATLSDLMVDGAIIDNFSSSINDYSYVVTSTTVPTITATTSVSGAGIVITDAATIPGTTTIEVNSTDGTVTETYSIFFSMNTECAGVSNEASQGDFTVGYNYAFSTSGTDVTVSFEMLDEKTGIVAFLFNRTDGFLETPLTNTDGVFSTTLSDQTVGATLTLACKFAYAGGLSVTKDFKYTVGENCMGTSTILNTSDVSDINVYPNPTTGTLNITATDGSLVSVYNVTGQLQKQEILHAGQVSLEELNAGIYFVNANNQMSRVIKK